MKKIAILFPGTGSQYVGMGKKLCESYEIANLIFDDANRILNKDLKNLCLNGRLTELSKYENLHPALLTVSYIFYKIYIENNNIVPVVGAGHSLGEYSALVCSGAISFEDALHLVELRGKSIDHIMGAMTVINDCDINYVTNLCNQMNKLKNMVYLSCINSDKQFILSGTRENIDRVEDILIKSGHKITNMYYSTPIHSPMMMSVADEIENLINKIDIVEPKYSIISNYTGQICKDVKTIKRNLIYQLTHTVLWRDTVDAMKHLDVDLYLEVGTKTVLKDLMVENKVESEILALDNNVDLKKFNTMVNMFNDRIKIHKYSNTEKIVKCLRIAVSTRNNNTKCSKEGYNQGVIEPYTAMKNLRLSIEKEGREASDREVLEAIEYLNSILDTKKAQSDFRLRQMQILDGRA